MVKLLVMDFRAVIYAYFARVTVLFALIMALICSFLPILALIAFDYACYGSELHSNFLSCSLEREIWPLLPVLLPSSSLRVNPLELPNYNL